MEDKENILLIVDSLRKYFVKGVFLPDDRSEERLVNLAKELGKKGATFIGDMGVFNYQHKIQVLIDYEISLPTHFDIDIKRVCLYHGKDFERFSDNIKERLINHHEIAFKLG